MRCMHNLNHKGDQVEGSFYNLSSVTGNTARIPLDQKISRTDFASPREAPPEDGQDRSYSSLLFVRRTGINNPRMPLLKDMPQECTTGDHSLGKTEATGTFHH
ncbi:uncharacterized protein LOC144379563 [Halichoerus grypus]